MDTDNRGQVPEVGDRVAYNYSGNIAVGIIVGIGKSRRYHSWAPIFKIRREYPKPGPHDSTMSAVKGGTRCLLVLEKQPTDW